MCVILQNDRRFSYHLKWFPSAPVRNKATAPGALPAELSMEIDLPGLLFHIPESLGRFELGKLACDQCFQMAGQTLKSGPQAPGQSSGPPSPAP